MRPHLPGAARLGGGGGEEEAGEEPARGQRPRPKVKLLALAGARGAEPGCAPSGRTRPGAHGAEQGAAAARAAGRLGGVERPAGGARPRGLPALRGRHGGHAR